MMDMFERPLNIGDMVVFSAPGSKNAPLAYGEVKIIHTKQITVEYTPLTGWWKGQPLTTKRYPQDLLKIPFEGPELMMYILKK